jgi:anthranilate synthase/phosphoribosyltransferase
MYLLLDNYDSFTYNIYQYLCELTEDEVKVVRSDTIDVEGVRALNPKAIILSPGPGRPEESGCMIDVIRAFAGQVPILGVCLGHQAIGYAFGGNIIGAKEIVHGKVQPISVDGKGVFRGMSSPTNFTRYHSLVIERDSLPAELEVTAWSPDGEIMGVRHKTLPIEGVQFHPESIASEGGKRLLKNFLTWRREGFDFPALVRKIMAKQDLSQAEAEGFMEELTDGNLSGTQIAAVLVGLSLKGIHPEEVAGCAAVLQRKRNSLPVTGDFLDIVGTGGDGHGTFNISSMAALVVSACGARVAKHGNRAVSSRSGSADFYSAMGLKIDLKPEQSAKVLADTGFAFLFAPVYHGAMKYAAPVRKELGVKTIMNLLGPLANPASATHQLIGVYDASMGPLVARAIQLLGTKKALVVYGTEGLDEMSVGVPTLYWLVTPVSITEGRFEPSRVGLSGYTLDDIKGGTADDNAALAHDLLAGVGRPAIRDAVCLNAGAALWLTDLATSIEDGFAQARKTFEDGRLTAKLDEVKAATAAFAVPQGV